MIAGPRKTDAGKNETPAKYCSSRCRSRKPGTLDKRIEDAFVSLLTGEDFPLHEHNNQENVKSPSSHHPENSKQDLQDRHTKKSKQKRKTDSRVLVPCKAVETLMFGDAFGSDKTSVRKRESQDVSEVNGRVGGEKGRAERIEEGEEMLGRGIEGQRKAHQREMVRCAARRGVAFGFLLKKGENQDVSKERRKCEAVMQDRVVEPSFAKGDWSIRWRKDGAGLD